MPWDGPADLAATSRYYVTLKQVQPALPYAAGDAPASLDDCPEVAFECEGASLAVVALLGAEADDTSAPVHVGPFERKDLASSPPAEVCETARILEVLRQMSDHSSCSKKPCRALRSESCPEGSGRARVRPICSSMRRSRT